MLLSNGGKNWRAAQWALLAALGVVAVVYFVMPSRAGDPPAWTAELWATERGEELVAVAYERLPASDGELVPVLTILCGGPFWLRYDPGPEPEPAVDWTGQSATFEFGFGDLRIERELRYEAMDGNWAIELAADDELLGAIRAGTQVSVLMPNGGLPEHTFSLKGSTAAIADVGDSCR